MQNRTKLAITILHTTIGGQVNVKRLALLTTSPLTNLTPLLTLIRYFQL